MAIATAIEQNGVQAVFELLWFSVVYFKATDTSKASSGWLVLLWSGRPG